MKKSSILLILIMFSALANAQTFDPAMKQCVVSPGKDLSIIFQSNPSILTWAANNVVNPSSTVEDYKSRLNLVSSEAMNNCPLQPNYPSGHPCNIYAASPTSLRVISEQIGVYLANINSYGCIPEEQTQDNDPDKDGLTNSQETGYGTNPDNADTDFDSYSDKQEIDAGSDPLDHFSTPSGDSSQEVYTSSGNLNLNYFKQERVGDIIYTIDFSKLDENKLSEDLKKEGLNNNEINDVIKSLISSSSNLVTGSFIYDINGDNRFAPLILIIFIIIIAGLKITFDRLLNAGRKIKNKTVKKKRKIQKRSVGKAKQKNKSKSRRRKR